MPNNSQAGKGDKPRNCFSSNFKNNYDEIQWGTKSSKYPEHLKELMYIITSFKQFKEKDCYIQDDWKVKDFDVNNVFGSKKPNHEIKKFLHKYKLDYSIKDMYIWEVVEKMHNFRPF